MSNNLDFLITRLNEEPILVRGCTQKEIMLVLGSGVLPCLVASGVIGMMLGWNIFFGMIPGALLGVGAFMGGTLLIQRKKRDKEPGYIDQMIQDILARYHLVKLPLIRRTGAWTIGREL